MSCFSFFMLISRVKNIAHAILEVVMPSILEDLEILPNGSQGDVVLKLGEEAISLSSFDSRVSFAVYLEEDSFPTNTFGYHFINIDDTGVGLGRNIENELPEIYWYSPKKCILLSGDVVANKLANLTVITPCVVLHNITFSNIDILSVTNKALLSLEQDAPMLSGVLGTGPAFLYGIGTTDKLGTKEFASDFSNLYIFQRNSFEVLKINCTGNVRHYGTLEILDRVLVDVGSGVYTLFQQGILKSNSLHLNSTNAIRNYGVLRANLAKIHSKIFENFREVEVNGTLSILGNQLSNQGSVHFATCYLRIEKLISNYGIILANSGLTTIEMSDIGEIHNLENAFVTLNGGAIIKTYANSLIATFRNFAGRVNITGDNNIIKIHRIDNLANKGEITNKVVSCHPVDRYSCSQEEQIINFVNPAFFEIHSNNNTLSITAISNDNSLFLVEGNTSFSDTPDISNVALSLTKTGTYNSDAWQRCKEVWRFKGVHSGYVDKCSCVGVNDRVANAEQDAINFDIGVLTWTGDSCTTSSSKTHVYKTYPSTVAFVDVGIIAMEGISNYNVQKADVPKLLSNFKTETNALTVYGHSDSVIIPTTILDLFQSINSQGYEISMLNPAMNVRFAYEDSILWQTSFAYNQYVNTFTERALATVADTAMVQYLFANQYYINTALRGTKFLLYLLGVDSQEIEKIIGTPDYEHLMLKRSIFLKQEEFIYLDQYVMMSKN